KQILKDGKFYKQPARYHGSDIIAHAALHQNPEHLKVLIEAGFPVKSKASLNGLHKACYYDSDPEIIKMLISAGLDPTDDSDNRSPMAMAANQGNYKVLKAIFEKCPHL